MKPVEIAEGIYNVGVKDWNIRDFHGYSTHLGTSYNAFLIVDEKVTLIDTVKSDFSEQFIENIAQIVDPSQIEYVVSNHTEMDHSGSFIRLFEAMGRPKPLFCSKMGAKNLARHFPEDWDYQAVENNEVLSLGKRSIRFIETRMLHWPDSMFSYLQEDKILFSSDAFGQHYSGYEEYDDIVGDAIMPHAKKYFANILLPYAPLVLKLIRQVSELGLELGMICPDHGVIWRHSPQKIVEAYTRWSRQESGPKAAVVYDTMWHSTEVMADEIADGLQHEGVAVRPMKLREWHRSDVMTEILDAKAIVVGSPTLNNGLFPTLSDFLTYMKGLKPLNRIGAAFGSFGWSGEAVKLITAELQAMKFDVIEPGIKIPYVPNKADRQACFEFGRQIGKRINESLGTSRAA